MNIPSQKYDNYIFIYIYITNTLKTIRQTLKIDSDVRVFDQFWVSYDLNDYTILLFIKCVHILVILLLYTKTFKNKLYKQQISRSISVRYGGGLDGKKTSTIAYKRPFYSIIDYANNRVGLVLAVKQALNVRFTGLENRITISIFIFKYYNFKLLNRKKKKFNLTPDTSTR